ncbi:DUF4136 domain-containing protein [Aquimarina brevivitae]|uniref:Uncharacterized protein DUF4136 n=1 Tax=Aquimarina brevivitae TaxID=323412 RepID=A0A4Q7PGT2_9FLAO|nr:DUF4136 domain-containing protein [Aquimarina brevivitae]RZS99118.1 uncharacterized protein DUF4136 [Aquimarina brevivitae]
MLKYINLLFLTVLFVSCGSTRVVYDYDDTQDFTKYQTFGFYPDLATGLSELDEERLLELTKSVLQAKGFEFSENPDVYINFNTATFKRASNNSIGVGVGSGGGAVNVGVGGAIPIGGPVTYLELTVDLVDAKENDLKWQAIAEQKFNQGASPNTKKQIFERLLLKIFKKYPPTRNE